MHAAKVVFVIVRHRFVSQALVLIDNAVRKFLEKFVGDYHAAGGKKWGTKQKAPEQECSGVDSFSGFGFILSGYSEVGCIHYDTLSKYRNLL